MRQEFGQGLTDEGVHVLDPFTGTGTFMVRLLQLGLIEPHDLARKYAEELHANEILLLAYYIAAVNIETTYYDVMSSVAAPGGGTHAAEPGHEYVEFPGLVLTDTFQSWEDDDRPTSRSSRRTTSGSRGSRSSRSRSSSATRRTRPVRTRRTTTTRTRSTRRSTSRSGTTYAERSTATLKNSLYDSYIRAIKWATLRIKDRGVIAYVTNGGLLDSNTADGMRKSLAEEFSVDLRLQPARQPADGRRAVAQERVARSSAAAAERPSRSPSWSRTRHRSGPATIHYTDIGDYLPLSRSWPRRSSRPRS